MPTNINVLVYGGGAIGSILGWRIAQHSHARISVICRSNFEHVRRGGFYFQTTVWGNGHFRPAHVLRASHFLPDLPRQNFDYVIAANKLTDGHDSMLRDLRFLVTPRTTLVVAQNGMGVEAPLRERYPQNAILSAICNIGCQQISPGFVEQRARIQRRAFLIGAYQHCTAPPSTVDRARDDLVALDSQFESIECASFERWRKLIFNAAWNAVTARTGRDTHGVLRDVGAVHMVKCIAEEANRIALAHGVDLGIPDLPSYVVDQARKSDSITPSTLQDVRRGRPMELEHIFGYLTRQAAQVGVDAPHLVEATQYLQQMSRDFTARRDQSPSEDLPEEQPDLVLPWLAKTQLQAC